jgi:hypothetical protein
METKNLRHCCHTAASARSKISPVTRVDWAGALLVLGTVLAAYVLLHPYSGIVHDARLYTLQALGRLYPFSVGQDVFLRFGSQDQFTIFSPAYAALCSLIGIDRAATALTLLGHLIFLLSCWAFAQKAVGNRYAWMVIAPVVLLPGHYGSAHVFSYFESFLTARTAAECLTVAALASLLGRYRVLSMVLLFAALLFHPIMAAGGCVFAALWVGRKRLTPRMFAWILGTLATFAAIIGLGAPGVEAVLGRPIRFDADWLPLVERRSPYLFLTAWGTDDWAAAAVPLATLLIGAQFNAAWGMAARCALLSALAGLILAFIGGDLFKLILVTQAQTWRWMWLATLISVLVLPVIVHRLWKEGSIGRASALLLMAAWLVRDHGFSAGVVVLALAAAGAIRCQVAEHRLSRASLRGAWILIACVVLYSFFYHRHATDWLVTPSGSEPGWLSELRIWSRGCLLPLVAVAAAIYSRTRERMWWPVLASIAGGIGLLLTYHTISTSLLRQLPAYDLPDLIAWRKIIPTHDEVLWLDDPVAAWVLLQRPSYISSIQTTATLFSRDAAMALRQRTSELKTVFPSVDPLDWEAAPGSIQFASKDLTAICAAIRVNFLVTREQLSATPVAVLLDNRLNAFKGMRLYQCRQNVPFSS